MIYNELEVIQQTLIIAIIVCENATCQGFGISSGLTSGNMQMKYYNGTDKLNGIGANYGVFYEKMINSKFSFKSEMQYSYFAKKKYYVDMKMATINIPLLVKYRYTKKIYGLLGPQIVALNYLRTIGGNFAESFRGFGSYGISGVLGLEYSLDPKINITLRYAHQLIGFKQKYNIGIVSGNPAEINLKNNTFNFGLAYRFNRK